MQKRRLGQTDLHVSILGLGTVKFGRNQGVKYPAAFNLPSDQDILNLLAQAQAFGINLLDTAPAYGTSEERLGKLLTHRQDWIISSKVGEEFIDGVSQFDFSPSAILQSVERSLQRLRTDYLDILLVHSDGNDEYLIKDKNIFATLADLKTAGKIRAYGMSTKTIAGGLLTIEQADVAMVAYNANYTMEQAVITHAAQTQKGILVKKALASGHLSAEALRFVTRVEGVTSVIIGTINAQHLQENIQNL